MCALLRAVFGVEGLWVLGWVNGSRGSQGHPIMQWEQVGKGQLCSPQDRLNRNVRGVEENELKQKINMVKRKRFIKDMRGGQLFNSAA